MRRACRAAGQSSTSRVVDWRPSFAGTIALSAPGSAGRIAWPTRTRGVNSSRRVANLANAKRTNRVPASRRRGWLVFDQFATEVGEPAVLHAGRAGGLAGAAGQAAVEVGAGGCGRAAMLEHLLDQVDAAARAVEFAAGDAVRRAGGQAEAAVHAVAQQVACLPCERRVGERVGGSGMHRRGLRGSRTSGPGSGYRPDRRRASLHDAGRAAAPATARRLRWSSPTAVSSRRKRVAWPPVVRVIRSIACRSTPLIQACAPFHSNATRSARTSAAPAAVARQRESPERVRRGEVRVGLFANAVPERGGSRLVQQVAADRRYDFIQARRGAFQADVQFACAPETAGEREAALRGSRRAGRSRLARRCAAAASGYRGRPAAP